MSSDRTKQICLWITRYMCMHVCICMYIFRYIWVSKPTVVECYAKALFSRATTPRCTGWHNCFIGIFQCLSLYFLYGLSKIISKKHLIRCLHYVYLVGRITYLQKRCDKHGKAKTWKKDKNERKKETKKQTNKTEQTLEEEIWTDWIHPYKD